MSKTNIDWCRNPDGTPGHTWNPVKGCMGPGGDGVHCEYCYAKKLVKRYNFPHKITDMEITYQYGQDWPINSSARIHYDLMKLKVLRFEPCFFEYVLSQKLRKKPAMCFFSMSDPADWKPDWHRRICNKIKNHPQHTFVVLTKRPGIYKKYNFPHNCWCGVTITNQNDLDKIWQSINRISGIINNKIFLSIEPIFEYIVIKDKIYNIIKKIDWIIVGPETGGKKTDAKPEWIKPFFDLDIPVFMKNSCKKIIDRKLRQEWPEGYII